VAITTAALKPQNGLSGHPPALCDQSINSSIPADMQVMIRNMVCTVFTRFPMRNALTICALLAISFLPAQLVSAGDKKAGGNKNASGEQTIYG
jgi:hypothetical protein